MLSQLYVAFNVSYQHIVHVYIRVFSTTITFVFAMFIFRHIRLLSSDSSSVVIVVFLCIRICHHESGDW